MQELDCGWEERKGTCSRLLCAYFSSPYIFWLHNLLSISCISFSPSCTHLSLTPAFLPKHSPNSTQALSHKSYRAPSIYYTFRKITNPYFHTGYLKLNIMQMFPPQSQHQLHPPMPRHVVPHACNRLHLSYPLQIKVQVVELVLCIDLVHTVVHIFFVCFICMFHWLFYERYQYLE